MKRGSAVLAVAVLTAAAAAGGWTAGRSLAGSTDAPSVAAPPATVSPSPAGASGAPNATARARASERFAIAERATVRLTPPGGGYVGSGTVVSSDGLVLTSAHVAAPQAPGLVDLYDRASEVEDPPYLVVAVQPPGDGPVVPMFRASVVAVDGYVDLAVLRIDATVEGAELPAAQRFRPIPLRRGAGLEVGERIDVLGFPVDVADGARLSIEEGTVVSTSPDPTGRVPSAGYSFDTSARLTGGYSGGAVIDLGGRLAGVPSASLDGEGASGRVRPVDFAGPLLVAAETGRPYDSAYSVKGTGRERAQPRGWGLPGQACEELSARTLEAGLPAIAGAAQFSGMSRGEEVVFALSKVGEDEHLSRTRSTWGPAGADGCMSGSFAAAAVGFSSGFPQGAYELRIYVGPDLAEVGRLGLVLR